MYAIIQTGGKQYRVASGDTLEIERLDDSAGAQIAFDQVLLIGGNGTVRVGTPTVAGATVTAEIVEHKRGPKLIAYKKQRREGYERTVGHRQELTVVKIKDIKA